MFFKYFSLLFSTSWCCYFKFI